MIAFGEWGYNQPLIHIGYPKALSSWLQKELFIPEMGFWPAMRPLSVQRRFIDPAPFFYRSEPIGKWLRDQLSEDKSLVPVISSESLSGNMRHGGYNAEQLARRISDTFSEPKILCIIREQKQLIRSLYSEVVKWGMPHSIANFLQPNRFRIAPQYRHEYLQFDGLVAHYQQRFGVENVLVLPYEMFCHTPGQFVDRVSTFSGVSSAYDETIP